MATIYEDFNYENGALGTQNSDWEVTSGTIDIVSNTAKATTSAWWDNLAYNTATSLGSINQYAKVTLSSYNASGTFGIILLRCADSDSPCYAVWWVGSDCGYAKVSDLEVVDWGDDIDTGAITLAQGNTIGVTIVGSGSDTVVRIWKNPSGNAPDAGGATWGSAGPDVTMDADPGDDDVSGEGNTYIGFGGEYTASYSLQFDDFYAGSISTRNVSGSFPSVSGVVSKSTLKTLTGVLPALSGSIVGEFITGLIEEALARTFPVITGSLDVIISKMLQGSIPAQGGTVVRITEKRVLGSAPSQSGSTVKSTAKEFEGQLGSVTGASLKLTAKNVSGLLPAISGVSSYVSVFLQEVLGAIPQITGAISKATTKVVTGIIPALSGSISRRAGKSLAGSIPYQVGGIVKDVDKKVQGAIPSLSGTASGVSVFLEGISGAVPYAVGSMVKMIGKGISGNTPSQAGQLVKNIAVSKTGSIPSPSGNPGEAYQTSEGTSGIFGAISGIVSYITGVIISKAVGIIGSRLKRIIGG